MIYDVDAHAYDEPRYEEHRSRLEVVYCERCFESEVVVPGELCSECIAEIDFEEEATA